jgi:hypothetical protein
LTVAATPWTRTGTTARLRLLYANEGKKPKELKIYVLVCEDEAGKPMELAIKADTVGSTIRGLLDVLGTTASMALERGASVDDVICSWRNTQFEPSGRVGQERVGSIVDAVAMWLASRYIPPAVP